LSLPIWKADLAKTPRLFCVSDGDFAEEDSAGKIYEYLPLVGL
jgi:hypothetical protein